MQNQTISEWINPTKSLRISNHTISFNNYNEFESISSAIDNDLSRILKTHKPKDIKLGIPTITIGKESYNYNTFTSKWSCSQSPSWFRRNIECYVAMNSQLSNIASAGGFTHKK